jgi:hypothetical protein
MAALLNLYSSLLFFARAVQSTALAAYTATQPTTNVNAGNISYVLTANANGALGNIDGVAVVVGDTILVTAGASANDNGLYFVTSLGSLTTPWVLTSKFQNFAQCPMASGQVIQVGGEGTAWGGANITDWKCTSSGSLAIGGGSATAFAFYPRKISGVGAVGTPVTALYILGTAAGLGLVDQTGANAVKGVLVAGAGTGTLTLTGTGTDAILYTILNW